ncbi:MAG: alpha/beta hydrolase [Chloroflexota bacterium]
MPLYVEESGAADVPSIVFIHAVSVSGWMWKQQIEALKTEFHCLNVDLPGHGQSNRVKWVSLEDSADQIAEIIRTRAHDGRANLCALSLGSYVGLTLLSRHPDLVMRAVLSGVSAAPLPNLWVYSLLGPVMALFMKMDRFIVKNAKGLNVPQDQLADYVTVARMTSRQAFIKASVDAARFTLSPNLATINVPTLIVAGENEHPLVKAAVKTIADLMPNDEGAIVPGVGHGWSAENPTLFTAMLRAWFSDQGVAEGLCKLPVTA